jgi:hypothetical protein
MKKLNQHMAAFLLLVAFMLLCGQARVYSQIPYATYFHSSTLRLEVVFTGNADSMQVSFLQLKQDPFWGGPRKTLLSPFDYGDFKVEVLLPEDDQLLYSRGFSTLFEEWQTTAEAKKIKRSFLQSIRIPMPAQEVIVKIHKRNWTGQWEAKWEQLIAPDNPMIIQESPKNIEVYTQLKSDLPNPVELCFVAEGYSANENDKFQEDLAAFSDFLFSQAPFDELISYFTVRGVFVASEQSGTDIPGKREYRSTALESSFYTFGSERYLTTSAVPELCDVASVVPYDALVVLVNTEKYGGGGIYNLYAIQSAHHALSKIVFVHEFGHSFGGLADEYYSSSVSYENFFNLEVEPWQPNITTRVEFETKWGDFLDANIPVPTPRDEKFANKVGVFEGGGYVSKGVFSPVMDCRMKSNSAPAFCPVCKESIREMVLYLSDQ